MKPISTAQLLDHLRWGYATQQFDSSRKISEADWDAIEEALILSPSSFGLQPWKFIVVVDPAVREQLLAAAWGQKQVVAASHFVVLAAKKDLGQNQIDAFLNRIVEVRGGSLEDHERLRNVLVNTLVKGPHNRYINEWAAHQVYIALGNLMTCAAVLGIDACPMEGINPKKYDEILGLEKHEFRTVVACALGYRADSDKYAHLPKIRYKKEDVLTRV